MANRYVKMVNVINHQGNSNQTTARYCLTPNRMAIIKNIRKNSCWQGCGERVSLVNCWWECKLVQPQWIAVWRFLKKLKIDTAISPLDIYLKNMKTLAQKRYICTPITALFTIAKI